MPPAFPGRMLIFAPTSLPGSAFRPVRDLGSIDRSAPLTTIAKSTSAESASSVLLFATACGLFSAVMYTVANAFLRAVTDCDPIWVSAVKAVPTVLLVGPWLILRHQRRQAIFPGRSVLLALILASMVGQLGGNVLFQYSLGVVGIAMGVAMTLGSIIVAGAILGRIFLNEQVTPRMALALTFLISAFLLLGLGAPQAYDSVADSLVNASHSWNRVALGVGAAIGAGCAYGVLGVVIRHGVRGRATVSTTMFTVGFVGLVSLGTLSVYRLGISGMAATNQRDLAVMLAAGVCNTIAFLALTKALQLTTLVFVNALNATQATMAAVAGVVFFGEALTTELVWGLVLTIAGLLSMQEGNPEDNPQGDS